MLGFVAAPYMISVFMLGERAAPAERVGAAMTLLAGATGIGYAVGSAGAGRLADATGTKVPFRPAVKAAGLPATLRFHDLRHTHAALLIADGWHPLAISRRLGHSTITVTKHASCMTVTATSALGRRWFLVQAGQGRPRGCGARARGGLQFQGRRDGGCQRRGP